MKSTPTPKLCAQITLADFASNDDSLSTPERLNARVRMRKYVKELNRRCGVKDRGTK